MLVDDLVGVWGVVSWTQEYDDGRTIQPMGASPVGRLTYTASGHVSAIITADDRENFAGSAQWHGSEGERAAAYDSCMAYAGTYVVDGTTVVHNVEVSLFPNWVGSKQRRTAMLTANELQLVGRIEEGTADARTVRLSWTRLA
jgi:Lipocalin-like domain